MTGGPSGPTSTVDAFIGVGSNLEAPDEQVERAFAAMASLPGTAVVAHSSLYRSAPMGRADQPDFVNAVVRLSTQLAPHALLDELQRIEHEAGRVRTGERWGPRTLDLDILVYGEQRIDDARLTVPHPGTAQREFAIVPLAELAPELVIPGQGRASDLAAVVDLAGLSLLREADS